MEKEMKMKIIPPEGYEIDKENSTFECVKFKPIKKDLTYEDVCNKIFSSQYFYIKPAGDIAIDDLREGKYDSNSSPYRTQLQKVLAINQLFNIAKYYNGDWEPDWDDLDSKKFYIDYYNGRYDIDGIYNTSCGVVNFRSKEDAQAVIDNPNFRDILDTIFK